eukprot:6199867-Pleurochrysis_carterae.AAC.7
MSTRGDGKKAKLTVTLLEETASEGHRFGVNALASTSSTLWGGGEQLISGGRDGTIRCWKLPQQGVAATPMLTLSDHTDWVNDLTCASLAPLIHGLNTDGYQIFGHDVFPLCARNERGGRMPSGSGKTFTLRKPQKHGVLTRDACAVRAKIGLLAERYGAWARHHEADAAPLGRHV